MKIIYIVGSGHCGSTIIDSILGAHSRIFGAGEIQNLRFSGKCSCSKNILDCDMWRDLKDKFNPEYLTVFRSKKNFLFNSDNFYYLNSRKKVIKEECHKINDVLFDNVARIGVDFIVDSSKDVDRLEMLSRNPKLDIQVIHIVRDGRAVSWSYIRKYNKLFPWIFKWFLSNLKIEIFKKRTKSNVLFLRYEDFVSNPKKEISKILNSVNLSLEDGMFDSIGGNSHQVGGNRLRFNKNIILRKDMSWESDMPKIYVILFNLLFGVFNLFYKLK